RRLSQLEVFNPGYDKVIYLSIPEELVRERLEKRERFDDTPDVIENRLKVYHTETEPLIGYFKNKEVLETVDASGSIEDVTEKLKKVLNIQDE
ncbi:MAG: Adenylate kinase, partial [Candidatus Daviesbacteria bacterium GW2011_GWA1_38_7]